MEEGGKDGREVEGGGGELRRQSLPLSYFDGQICASREQ